MHFFQSPIFTLLSVSAVLVQYPYASAATDCDDTIEDTWSGDVCKDIDGTCPKSCIDAIDHMHNFCIYKQVQGVNGEEPYSISHLVFALVPQSHLISDNCDDALTDWVLSRDDVSCADWLSFSSDMKPLNCVEECSDECKRTIDKVYTVCKADDSVVNSDEKTITAKAAEEMISQGRNAECNDYADTLQFEGKGNAISLATTMFTTITIVNVVLLLLSAISGFTLAM